VVWEQAGHGADIEADLAMSLLEGSGLPVRRIPDSAAPVLFDGFGGPMMPVRLLVPTEREAEARELLAEVAEAEPDPADDPEQWATSGDHPREPASPGSPDRSTPLERWLLRALLVVTAVGALCFAVEIGGNWGVMGFTVKDWALGTPFERQLPVVTHYWPAVVMGLMMLLWFAWMVARGKRKDGG
jgi:hypothetical protein